MEEPIVEQTSQESDDTTGPEADTSQGYCIHFYVLPQGYRVSSAEPMSHEGTEEESEGDIYPDMTTALKHLVSEVKAHPVGDDSQAQFQAGVESGPAASSY